MQKTARSASGSSGPAWADLMAAHVEASARYAAAAHAAQTDPAREDEADDALRDLLRIENEALAAPAVDATAFRFKLSIWAINRVEGFEDEWRVIQQDCDRLLAAAASEA